MKVNPNECPKHKIVVDMDNDYLKALLKSIHQFLIEESTGSINADLRLQAKIEAAKTLYPDEMIALRNGRNYFGKFNTGNVELIFNVKE